MRDLNRFRGCLLGGAAGDALGYTVEFMGEGRIFSKYGEQGITAYELTNGSALISDDTQMTLFTASGLLQGTTRGIHKGFPIDYAQDIGAAYMAWYRTQTEAFPLPEEQHASWLTNVPELFDRRAPGNTCLYALRSGRGNPSAVDNDSKGCGGVMRVAPVGLYFNDRHGPWDEGEVIRLGMTAAAITHGHPLGQVPAGIFAQMIHEISQNGADIRKAAIRAMKLAEQTAENYPEKCKERMNGLLTTALELAAEKHNDLEAIHQLGEGWIAEETLAIAVYCAAKYEDDFERTVVAAVNHKGDSDSTGAVAGNIAGAKVGLTGIPEKFITGLELKDVILEIAEDLWKGDPNNGPEKDPLWNDKYYFGTYQRGE